MANRTPGHHSPFVWAQATIVFTFLPSHPFLLPLTKSFLTANLRFSLRVAFRTTPMDHRCFRRRGRTRTRFRRIPTDRRPDSDTGADRRLADSDGLFTKDPSSRGPPRSRDSGTRAGAREDHGLLHRNRSVVIGPGGGVHRSWWCDVVCFQKALKHVKTGDRRVWVCR